MKKLFILGLCSFSACGSPEPGDTVNLLKSQERFDGKTEYLNSPFVAAGDRVYVVGHQDGSFPDLGWHVTGEMGGIWDHPIKLMDGFGLHVKSGEMDWCLDDALSFTNFPVGNRHHFQNGDLSVDRYQFVPDGTEGAVIMYEFTNESSGRMELDLTFTGMIDLSPVWLWDSLGIVDGTDLVTWDEEEDIVWAQDENNPWVTIFGSDTDVSFTTGSPCEVERRGLGTDASLVSQLVLGSGSSETVGYFVSGSNISRKEAMNTFRHLKNNYQSLLEDKLNRYVQIATTNQLITGDAGFNKMFRWIKFNTDWLVRDVPQQGRALSAGIPDYPWWFGTDNGYIIQGLLAAGMHEEALSTIDLIIRLSRANNGNGQIVHEVSTNGVVFNPGNLNTTPYFIYALWRAFEWTGDQRIIDEYYDDVVKGIEWIEAQDKDGNGYPDGAGMMEIHGLHSEMIDVVSYLAKAYQSAANFALIKGDVDRVEAYEDKAVSLKNRINNEWWVEEFGSFADFRSSRDDALELIDAAIVRADTINKPWSVEDLKETRKEVEQKSASGIDGYVVHHNWVVNTPMEMGLADSTKANIALETAKKYQNRFGMFVTGIDRDETQEKAEQWKSFSYVGAVMTLPTGVQAISAALYGYPNDAFDYLRRLQNSFSYAFPGSMYEVSPDFGMITQAWNLYAVAVPIVQHMFGIYPSAFQKKIYLTPSLPSAWQNASLTDTRVGNNLVSIDFSKTGNTFTYRLKQSREDWSIVFINLKKGKVKVNNQPVFEKERQIILTGEDNTVTIAEDET